MSEAVFYYRNPAAPRPNRPPILGTCAIVQYKDTYLMESRADSDRWAFIGGAMEPEESLEDCILREILEETGLKVSPTQMQFVGVYSDPSRIASYPDGNIARIVSAVYWIVLDKEPVLRCSKESKQLSFFTIEELAPLTVAETQLDILSDFIEALL